MTEKIHACPTCGPTATEPHPRLPVDRCSNCKEHITPGAARTTTSGGAGECTCPSEWWASGEAGHLQECPCHRCDLCRAEANYCRPPGPPVWTEAPAPEPGLRERYAKALITLALFGGRPHKQLTEAVRENAYARADAVLAVRDRRMEQLRGKLAKLRADFTALDRKGAELWETHNLNVATLDRSLKSTMEAQKIAQGWRDAANAAEARLAVRDAELQQLREELQRLREESPWLRATAEDLADAKATIARVRALRADWLSAGAPPIGTSINRWWDKRLIELAAALDQPQDPS